MKPTYQDIKAAAQYHWPEIHAALGMEHAIPEKQTPALPRVWRKDRFRYDDKGRKQHIHLQPLQQRRGRWFRLGNALFEV